MPEIFYSVLMFFFLVCDSENSKLWELNFQPKGTKIPTSGN
ncbi:hypothetical protein GCWU000325_02465 [Alloprevotella tannerae ATCC 51259]|uniref:Uncharacterized protein n=1 Tax=Alloprevotella tannerae ATCC 51259 TaxID=626522 RepID=C9LJQ2_9BACT|nr:hypothetical protein GCWU000325_02465 [Alloprevotella tannerae ATCC 51259]